MLVIDTITFNVEFAPYGNYNISPCNKSMWDLLILSVNNNNPKMIIDRVYDLLGDSMPCKTPLIGACRAFIINYISAVDSYCNDNFEKFKIPEHLDFKNANEEEDEEKEPLRYPIFTFEEYMVKDYTGLNFNQIAELNILQYKYYAADAQKVNILKRVDGTGTQYLNECYDYMNEMKDFNIDDLLDD